MGRSGTDKTATSTTDTEFVAGLIGKPLPPDRRLLSTDGHWVDLAHLAGRSVVYVHPMIRRPGAASPPGWEQTPGARGCTAQSCAFRDAFVDLMSGAHVFGLSIQSSAEQHEAVLRLHLPFPLLSDADLAWSSALGLPSFEVGQLRVLRRLTLIVRDGRIEHVFYPVPVPEENAFAVLVWLHEHPL